MPPPEREPPAPRFRVLHNSLAREARPSSPTRPCLDYGLSVSRVRRSCGSFVLYCAVHGIPPLLRLLVVGNPAASRGHCSLRPPSPGLFLALDHLVSLGWRSGLHRG